MKRFSVVLMALAVLAPAGVTLAVPIPALAQGRDGTGLGPAQVRALRVELSVAISGLTTARGEAGAALRQAAASLADLVRVGQLLGLPADASPEDVVQAAARWVEQDAENRDRLADLTRIVHRIETGEIRDRAEYFVEEARIAFEDGRLQDADRVLEQLEFLRQSASVEAGDLWIQSVTTRSAFARQRQDFDGAERMTLEARQEARRRARHDDFLLSSDLGLTAYQSGQSGDNEALVRAIDYYTEALSLVDRADSPVVWARTKESLGDALSTLGERESGTERLAAAVVAYRAALDEFSLSRVSGLARTQESLGDTLLLLGERESGTARLEEAVAAYLSALEELTLSGLPTRRAEMQKNLGDALSSLGAREDRTLLLEEAVASYRAALKEYTRDRVPLNWAMTQNSLGNALSNLAIRETGTTRLEEALLAYLAAEEFSASRVVGNWAALYYVDRASVRSVVRFEGAVAAYEDALAQQASNQKLMMELFGAQNDLDVPPSTPNVPESGGARDEEKVTAYRAKTEEASRAFLPFVWALARLNRAQVQDSLFDRTGDVAFLESALAIERAALEVFEAAGEGYYVERGRRRVADLEAKRAAVP